MGTDADRREEARMEEIDERLERQGVTCEDCGYCWIPGRGCCPKCGGAITDGLSPVKEGHRYTLKRIVERYPHFVADPGMTGTVTEVDEDLIRLELDDPLPGAEEWDNEIYWTDNDGPVLEVFLADVTRVEGK